MDPLALSFAEVTPNEYKILKTGGRMTDNLVKKVSRASEMDKEGLKRILESAGVGCIAIDDDDYPEILRTIYDPPLVLYYSGDGSVLTSRMLGIVGSRKSTGYTRAALEHIMPGLGKEISIVSGLAYGADETAHILAMDMGLRTVGVLAFGHGTHYPKSTLKTRRRMEGTELVISEYPPGTPIAKWRFIARNRIIAGLSQGVLVTEAENGSGSLITLDMALNENREAFCIPGNIHAPLSAGANARIQEGARMVLSGEDIMKDFRT